MGSVDARLFAGHQLSIVMPNRTFDQFPARLRDDTVVRRRLFSPPPEKFIFFPRCIRAILMVALSMIPGICGAQEALRNAIVEDKAALQRQAAQDNLAGQPKADLPAFTLGGSVGLAFNDNINLAQVHPPSDVIIRPEVTFNGRWPVSKTSQLTFGVGVGYQKYFQHSEYDQLTLTPNSELALDIPAHDFIFTFYDRVKYSQNAVSQAALSAVARYSLVENTVGTRVTWQPDDWRFQVGYGHGTTFSPRGDYSYLNSSSEQFFGRAGFRLAVETQAGLEASGTRTDYDSDTQSDVSSYSFGPFVEWKITRAFQINLRGGYSHNIFDPTNSLRRVQTLDSYYSYVDISHHLTDFISHSLSGGHQILAGVNQGSQYVESSTARYQINWEVRRKTSLSGSVSYEIGQQPGIGGGGQLEKYNQLGFGLGIQQGLTQKLSSGLAYNFVRRDSNLSNRGYAQNSVLLTFTYQF